MVNEKAINELKKFNADLDKHLPNMNLDFMKNDTFEQSEPAEEMLALLVNTVNDLKIEVALTRKNMADNIEGMVLRVLNNEHNMLVKQVNDFNTKMFANVRDSFGSYITQVNTELSSIRKEFNKITIATDNMTEMFKTASVDMKEMNMYVDDFKNIRKEVNFGISRIDEKLEIVAEDMKKLKSDTLSINDIKNIKKEVFIGMAKMDEKLNITTQNVKKLESKIPKIDIKKELNQIRSSVIDNKKEIKHFEQTNPHNYNDTSNEELILENRNNIPVISINEHLGKILTIDERLRKLDALK